MESMLQLNMSKTSMTSVRTTNESHLYEAVIDGVRKFGTTSTVSTLW